MRKRRLELRALRRLPRVPQPRRLLLHVDAAAGLHQLHRLGVRPRRPRVLVATQLAQLGLYLRQPVLQRAEGVESAIQL